MRFFSRVRIFFSLDRAGKILALEALGFSVFIAVAFRLVGVPKTQAWLRRISAGVPACPPTDASLWILRTRRALRMVRRTTGLDGMCLARSLNLWTLLRRRGVETDLRIGYRKREGRIEGHAWLDYQGRPATDSPDVVGTYTIASHPTAFDEWHQAPHKKNAENAP